MGFRHFSRLQPKLYMSVYKHVYKIVYICECLNNIINECEIKYVLIYKSDVYN